MQVKKEERTVKKQEIGSEASVAEALEMAAKIVKLPERAKERVDWMLEGFRLAEEAGQKKKEA
jgi:ABC-type multidrug transport system ATPase subunit